MIFTQDSAVQDAFKLPKGKYCADFGFYVEQGVEPDHVLQAAQALLSSGESFAVASQAGVIVKAQELTDAFDGWAPLILV
jgi:hypothetical protein